MKGMERRTTSNFFEQLSDSRKLSELWKALDQNQWTRQMAAGRALWQETAELKKRGRGFVASLLGRITRRKDKDEEVVLHNRDEFEVKWFEEVEEFSLERLAAMIKLVHEGGDDSSFDVSDVADGLLASVMKLDMRKAETLVRVLETCSYLGIRDGVWDGIGQRIWMVLREVYPEMYNDVKGRLRSDEEVEENGTRVV